MNPFRPPITALRWAAVGVGLVLAVTGTGDRQLLVLPAGAVLIAYAAWRTRHPIDLGPSASQVAPAVEAMVHVLVVAATGLWESPFVLSLLTAVLVVGFARGFTAAVRVGLLSAAAVAVPFHLAAPGPAALGVDLTAQWTTELLLVAGVAGYARRFSIEVAERHWRDVDRLDRLAEANALLHSLHDVAQALPASLDLDEALDSVVARVRTFFDVTALVLLLPEEQGPGWVAARQSGCRLPARLGTDELPAVAAEVVSSPARARRIDPSSSGGGFRKGSRSGLYVPLRARDEVVGVLAVEHDSPDRFSARDAGVLDGFAESAAFAVDNARRFGRLRRVSAAEERSRIAGELHDRVGQSLASMAFEIDLLVRHQPDEKLRPGLTRLGGGLRAVIGDIRDTLSDLRTEVTETRGLVEAVEAFVDRVNRRSGHKALFHYGRHRRLPLAQEQVMWHILYDTASSALRRGDCSLEIWWSCDGTNAALEMTTDVDGFDLGEDSTIGSGWVDGVRELAAGIGASVESEVLREGTRRLTCLLGTT